MAEKKGLATSNLYTPKGSTMRAGSNTNAWENNLQYTPEQTSAGYGYVPAMTMNVPTSPGLARSTNTPGTYMQRTPSFLQQKSNDLFGTSYGTGTVTQDQLNFEAANPNATLDAGGNWSGLTTNANGAYEGSLGKSNGTSGGWGDYAVAAAAGVQGLAGLANAYMANKNLKLAKDMFGFEKATTNRNLANQAQLVNNQIQNAGEVGMSLAGNTMDPNARAARQAQLDTMKVSGTPIG